MLHFDDRFTGVSLGRYPQNRIGETPRNHEGQPSWAGPDQRTVPVVQPFLGCYGSSPLVPFTPAESGHLHAEAQDYWVLH